MLNIDHNVTDIIDFFIEKTSRKELIEYFYNSLKIVEKAKSNDDCKLNNNPFIIE